MNSIEKKSAPVGTKKRSFGHVAARVGMAAGLGIVAPLASSCGSSNHSVAAMAQEVRPGETQVLSGTGSESGLVASLQRFESPEHTNVVDLGTYIDLPIKLRRESDAGSITIGARATYALADGPSFSSTTFGNGEVATATAYLPKLQLQSTAFAYDAIVSVTLFAKPYNATIAKDRTEATQARQDLPNIEWVEQIGKLPPTPYVVPTTTN